MELGGIDQFFVGYCYLKELAIQVCLPERKKFSELGKARMQIEFLPNIGLEQSRVIRHAVENFCRRERVALQDFAICVSLMCCSIVSYSFVFVFLIPFQVIEA